MYTSLEAELHDLFWDAEGPPAELPLIRDFLGQHPGRSLEFGCGSGRLLLPLLKEGFDIEGLDNAPEMLSLCRRHAAKQFLNPTLHGAEVEEFQPSQPYQAIAVPAFTLQLLPDPPAALTHLRQWLSDGGGLYLTVFEPLAELEGDLPENESYLDHQLTLPDGTDASIHTRHELDRANRILTRHHHYELKRDGESLRAHDSTQVMHYFEEGELESALVLAGFELKRYLIDFGMNEEEDETAGITTYHAVAKEGAA
ncbi:MAG: class I SAM-dependent methyltransferase [Verrucomicrobiota bacterium JB023]|nr:class I SAM-dependent methyltransferase [Verrucomicrobiota bacterium JB023]